MKIGTDIRGREVREGDYVAPYGEKSMAFIATKKDAEQIAQGRLILIGRRRSIVSKFGSWLWTKCGEKRFTEACLLMMVLTCAFFTLKIEDLPPGVDVVVVMCACIAGLMFIEGGSE